jgi:competence protein ComEA
MAVSTLDPFTRHRSELTRQPSTQIDINTASVEELQLMPGIGVKTASDITADRERAGLFETADDLTRVKGIGERTVQRLRNSQLSRK